MVVCDVLRSWLQSQSYFIICIKIVSKVLWKKRNIPSGATSMWWWLELLLLLRFGVWSQMVGKVAFLKRRTNKVSTIGTCKFHNLSIVQHPI